MLGRERGLRGVEAPAPCLDAAGADAVLLLEDGRDEVGAVFGVRLGDLGWGRGVHMALDHHPQVGVRMQDPGDLGNAIERVNDGGVAAVLRADRQAAVAETNPILGAEDLTEFFR